MEIGTEILLRRRNGDRIRYRVETVRTLNLTQVEVMRQQHVGLVIVLLPPEGGDERSVIIAAPLVEVLPTPTPGTVDVGGTIATVRQGPLRLRQAPGLSASVVAVLPVGARIQVDPQPLWNDGLYWVHVVAPLEGWVVSSYLVLSVP